MKAWIYICAAVFAAGMLTALAQEAKTDTQPGATTSIPANTNEVAVPPSPAAASTPAPAIAGNVKTPAVAPVMQTSAVPAQPKISAAPTNATSPPAASSGTKRKGAPVIPPSVTTTSTPAAAGEVTQPEDMSLVETSAVPAQSNIITAPPPESSGMGRKGILAISVAFLAVAGGLAVFLLRSSRKADHASLITRAMGEQKDEHKDEEKHDEQHEDKSGGKIFPPPMT